MIDDISQSLRLFAGYHTVCNQWDESGEACLRDVLLKAADEIERLRGELDGVADMVDDILFDASWHPRDEHGNQITGDSLYLLDHPVQDRHMPALREWFVRYSRNRWWLEVSDE